MRSSLGVAGVSGALYGQAATFPLLLMADLGLSARQFSLVMMAQAACHVLGSLSARFWLRRIAAIRLVPWALAAMAFAVAWLCHGALSGPSVAGFVGPIALAAFGGAHSYPVLVTAGARDFPEAAGAGAALLGSLQMAAGALVALSVGVLGTTPLVTALALAATLALACVMGFLWLVHDGEV